jgi:hypothetical protein
MRKKPEKDEFLETLREGLLGVLKDDKASPGDKLKAIEIGAKLYMIQHKVKGIGDDSGKFFST